MALKVTLVPAIAEVGAVNTTEGAWLGATVKFTVEEVTEAQSLSETTAYKLLEPVNAV